MSHEGPVYVRLDKAALKALDGVRFERDHKSDDQYAFGYVSPSDYDQLQGRAGVAELSAALSRRAFDAKTLEPLDEEPNGDPFAGYHDYTALTATMRQLATQYPNLAKLETAGKSVGGRELWYMRISAGINLEAEQNKPKVLYIANMHGDETVGRELMLNFIETLLSKYATDTRIKALVDNGDLFLMPSMNPDGFESQQRYNKNGKDLNRNFPDFTSDPHDTMDGREPETKAIMQLHAQHHFLLAVNYHGGEVCFNIPWDTRDNQAADERFGDDAVMVESGREYTRANAPMYANHQASFDHGLTYGYEWYEVDGGMQDWAIWWRRSIHATIELSYSKWPNASTLPQYWAENQEAMLRYLERGLVGAHLVVTDATGTTLPADTKVTVKTDRRSIVYDSPFIHRPLPTGSHTVTVEIAGRGTKSVSITAAPFTGSYQAIGL